MVSTSGLDYMAPRLPRRTCVRRSVAAPIFFFQAEDGIRDWSVTGVQTCALPIFSDCHDTLDRKQLQQPLEKGRTDAELRGRRHAIRERISFHEWMKRERIPQHRQRSEERRVGKEGR